MSRKRKPWAIPTSKYTSSRRRRARKTKIQIRVHYSRDERAWDKDHRAANRPLGRDFTRQIDTALARIAKPPKPAQGYKRPVHDPRAKHQTPPTWTYGWIASSTDMAVRREAAA